MEPITQIRTGARPRRTVRAIRSFARALLLCLAAAALLAAPAFASADLVILPDPKLLGIMIVGLALLIFPSNQLIFKPIFRAIDERTDRIDGARSRAAHIQRDASAVLADYESRIREARADADTARKESISAARAEQASMTAAARREAETRIERAREILHSDLETARTQMLADARELAHAAAEQILGRSL